MIKVAFRPVLSVVATLRKLETILLSLATTAAAITPLGAMEGGVGSAITFVYFHFRLGNRTMHFTLW